MKKKYLLIFLLTASFICGPLLTGPSPVMATPPDPELYTSYPPFLAASVPPLVMLVMGRDHKLFYEAYNDASDLDSDGTLDITYKPDSIDYYGYFDSYKYYAYNSGSGLFEPAGLTTDKKVPAGDTTHWSGDFLNYLTMSRMDCLRKVLYGGYRVTDTDTQTILERAFIPQDAHSWGKEYESVAVSGYDIRDYAPLALPAAGTRHLFASTSLYTYTNANYKPLLRVAPNNTHRIWNWVAKESPVCDNSIETTGTTYTSHPSTSAEFQAMVDMFANASHEETPVTTSTPTQINATNTSTADYYLSVVTGTLHITIDGDYWFGVDGDDAVEVLIDGAVVSGYYGGHSASGVATNPGSVYLTAGDHTVEFRHEEMTGGASYYLYWKPPGASTYVIVPASAFSDLELHQYNLTVPGSTITDYRVRVEVADDGVGVEANCKQYPNGNYKPVGVIQRHGESDKIYFGLMSGSYAKNTSGGVLRKPVGSITDEIDPNTGVLTATNGIIRTIDKFRIYDYNYSSRAYNGGWETEKPMSDSSRDYPDWGNPTAEMMYETLRYFAHSGSATSDYDYSGTTVDSTLGLPKADWSDDPFVQQDDDGNDTDVPCAKPIMLVISDINPSYDSDEVPGSLFAASGWSGGRTVGTGTLNVQAELDAISAGINGLYYIGQESTNYTGSCAPKTVDDLGEVRGLCPEEPTKEGGYYAAAVAKYGHDTDLRDDADMKGDQKTLTYSVALSSPLPEIEIPVGDNVVTLTPFGKTVWVYKEYAPFQPTCTIVDFFVEEISADRRYGKFRINYEDVEQGADHDMDVIVVYEYEVQADDTIKITLTKEYESAGYVMHLGYIISGTTKDGTYLEVASQPTNDPLYFMDTPTDRNEPGRGSSTLKLSAGVSGDSTVYSRSRVFTPSGDPAAQFLKDPLWYAAKWGGYNDKNNSNTPDEAEEWDKDGDGDPDNYYFVVNPLKLEEKLNKSFADIGKASSAGTTASVLANNSEGEGHVVQAYFKPELELTIGSSGDKKLHWLGYMQSLWVDPWGNMREDSNANGQLDLFNASESSSASSGVDKIIVYEAQSSGNTQVRVYTTHHLYNPANGLNGDCYLGTCPDLEDSSNYSTYAIEDITPIFEAGKVLSQRSADSRQIFTFIDGDGTDNDGDGTIDESGEDETGKTVGLVANQYGDDPFDNNYEVIPFDTANLARLKPFLGLEDDTAEYVGYLDADPTSPSEDSRATNLIEYIRGKDQYELTGNPLCRDRTIDAIGSAGTVWKLGDIVSSTPTSISGPPNGYNITYADESYQDYVDWSNSLNGGKGRESMIYVGANDGMLHAFTQWAYNLDTAKFEAPDTTASGEVIGDEVWAYIPQALLPHLKFLPNPEYGHTYYVDLQPRVFDAQILSDDTHYTDGDSNANWGTFMLVGLNLGGREIWADGDFDGDGSLETREFHPTFACIDITEPRAPRVLWERTYENLALTTSFPNIISVGASRANASSGWTPGSWYAVLGSGPTAYDGTSDQSAYAFIVDLKTGDLVRTFNTGVNNALMNSPVSYDKDLNFTVDSIYFGSVVADGSGGEQGYVFKINTRTGSTKSNAPSTSTSDWTMSTLFDSPTPISAPLNLSTDQYDNVWAFFGTGRYMENNAYKIDQTQQYAFGIKDPYFNEAQSSYYYNDGSSMTLDMSDLFSADSAQVYTNQDVTGVSGVNNWSELLAAARAEDGWYISLDAPSGVPSERVISMPTVLGGIVFFPGYSPNQDVCDYGGTTQYYALYYETGTAYYKHILPGAVTTTTTASGETEEVNRSFSAGSGAPPPAAGFHTGREAGATAFLQMSSGEVVKITVDTAFPIKSAISGWRDPE